MKKKLVAALLCGAMAAGSITVYAETVHAEGDTTITVMASQDWVYDAITVKKSPWMKWRQRLI